MSELNGIVGHAVGIRELVSIGGRGAGGTTHVMLEYIFGYGRSFILFLILSQ